MNNPTNTRIKTKVHSSLVAEIISMAMFFGWQEEIEPAENGWIEVVLSKGKASKNMEPS